MEILDAPIPAAAVEARLDALAARHRQAGNAGVELLNLIGAQAEGLLDRLPPALRDRLGERTDAALRAAMAAAHRSRGVVADSPGWLSRAVITAMGGVGGMGGLPTALVELPLTVTVLLRAIQDVAVENGFDPAEPGVQYDCVEVLAAAGPLAHDDGAELGFIGARVTVTGAALNALIARVAPRLAAVLGQKLAAQTVPVLGAAAGALTNYVYTGYYQQMAQVHFGLRRLAIEADLPHDEVLDAFRRRVAGPPAAER
ncbi:MAG: hypothetical protein Kow0058_02770 [Roseovarius sp.]